MANDMLSKNTTALPGGRVFLCLLAPNLWMRQSHAFWLCFRRWNTALKILARNFGPGSARPN